jgi:acyl-CoA synthetase (AMP-forming)/AMP-acid ligase II
MMQSIFSKLERHGHRPCLIAQDRRWTYDEAVAAADAIYAGSDLPGTGLVFITAHDGPETILAYIGAVRRGYAVHLLDPAKPGANARLARRYRPDLVFDGGAERTLRVTGRGGEISEEIAILLSTSGSTGTPKLVKLSHGNIAANTGPSSTISGSAPADVGITSLKPFYSYGMSVVNTHLVAGRRPCRDGSRHGRSGLPGAGPAGRRDECRRGSVQFRTASPQGLRPRATCPPCGF